METSQSKVRQTHWATRVVAIVMTLVLMATSSASAFVTAETTEMATTQSFTYYSDVPSWGKDTIAKCINAGYIRGTGTENGVLTLDLSEDLVKTLVILDRAGQLGDAPTSPDESWLGPIVEEPESSQEDRTKPIYEVYKDGFHVEVPVEIQWIIRDFAREYNYDEKIIFGLALAESTFQPDVAGDSGKSLGLYQIQKFWITGAAITHFTDDYRSRDLFDPYDATLTLMEIWEYARTTYDIDITTDQGMKDLLYWHNCGSYIKNVNWSYSNKVFGFADELIPLQ